MMQPLLTATFDRAAASVDAEDDRHPDISMRACDAMDRHSHGRRATVPILYMLFGMLFSCGPGCSAARAACDAFVKASPVNGMIDAAAISMKVPWLSQWPERPPNMHLVLGGSSSNGADGKVKGQQDNLTQSDNAGAVSTGVAPIPVITGVTPTEDSITYQWESPVQYTSYNVRITGRPQGNTPARQSTWSDLDASSPYTISVQGCGFAGPGAAACSGWASRAISTLPPTPTPATDSGP